MTKKIPIGVDDFAKLIDKNRGYLFIDKSLMIKELLDSGTEVSLIIRPRRWGKTLNMSMLRYFFAPEVNGQQTQGLFDNLKIAKEDQGSYLKKQGSHPVIFISFKNIKQDTWEGFCQKVAVQVASVYREYELILTQSNQLTESQKQLYSKILRGEGSIAQLEDSLKLLSECLYRHYGQKVILLIDEYDTPLNAFFNKDYFEKVVNFFKSLLGAALKGNDALEKGVMTGILRLSKNRMLSDINNLKLHSLMEESYSQCFGFSDAEVNTLFVESGITVDMKVVQQWYNGYRSGAYEGIYNPWSILNCIEDKGALKPYWIKTGDESILEAIFKKAPKSVEDAIITLLENNPIEATIDEYVSFDEVGVGSEGVLWSLLWTTGYLKFAQQPVLSEIGNYVGLLAIPNYEVSCSYRAVFPKWVRSFNRTQYDSFLKNLVTGNIEAFVKELSDYMLTIPSWFDFPQESNYHTFLLGLTASLQETHEVYSNQEIGLGRPDMLLIPRNTDNPLGIILEFKRVGKQADDYQKVVDQAFQQISIKAYDATLKKLSHIKRILKLCVVFYGKQFVYRATTESFSAPYALHNFL